MPVKNTFVDFPDPSQHVPKAAKSDSELQLQRDVACRRRDRSPAQHRPTDLPEADATQQEADLLSGTNTRKRRPGKKEREQMKNSKVWVDGDTQTEDVATTSIPWRTVIFLLFVTLNMMGMGYGMLRVLEARHRDHEQERRDRVNQERKDQMELEQRHNEKMNRPVAQLLEGVKDVVQRSTQGKEDSEAILSKLDNEKFSVHTGAWKFTCAASNLEASVRSKLEGPGKERLPAHVVNSIVSSLQYDEDVSTMQRSFDVDGQEGKGQMYQYRLQSTQSNGKASVALMAFGVEFDMKKVVDHYETSEEPVYEFVEAKKEVKRKCTTRATDGRLCVFPFEYRGQRFLRCTTFMARSLWCATSTDQNEQMYNWGFCDAEHCSEEEEAGPRYVKKFVRMAEKKFPIYAKRALPHGVSQASLHDALDEVASKEALKILR